MIEFSMNGTLPSGIHLATWQQVEELLAFNDRRRELLAGLKRACEPLEQAGCQRIYIGGSFATNKEFPGDFDVCWEDDNVDFVKLKDLDPVLLNFDNNQAAQKAKYGGELFPASLETNFNGKTHLEFFQQDRDGNAKGIIAIDLSTTS
jgi:hypothetical protein